MRELKFRAWNGEAMEYGGFGVHAGGKIIIDASGLTKVTEDSPVMQFTGLHDKNGKEIYEGDIVQEGLRHWTAQWNQKYLKFELTSETTSAGMYGFSGAVIGNIYENPDLLK